MPSADWDAALRGAGLRSTAQRRAVLRAVSELRHATVDEVCAHVMADIPEVSLSTVYRTLETLDQVGLVTHTHLHHGGPTYHSVDTEPHIHLVCTACGAVLSQPVDVAAGMAAVVQSRTGFHADLSHLALHGRCSRCLGGGAPVAEPTPAQPTMAEPAQATEGAATTRADHPPGSGSDAASTAFGLT